MQTTYFLGRETLIAPRRARGMALWREKLFAFLEPQSPQRDVVLPAAAEPGGRAGERKWSCSEARFLARIYGAFPLRSECGSAMRILESREWRYARELHPRQPYRASRPTPLGKEELRDLPRTSHLNAELVLLRVVDFGAAPYHAHAQLQPVRHHAPLHVSQERAFVHASVILQGVWERGQAGAPLRQMGGQALAGFHDLRHQAVQPRAVACIQVRLSE